MKFTNDKIITYEKFHSRFEAEVAKCKLEANGIPAMVTSDDAGGMEPQFQFIRGVLLLIREKDKDQAAEILRIDEEDNLTPGS